MNRKIVITVQKKKKASTKILQVIMAVLAILFCIMAIMFTTGYMMMCFLMALMYFIFEANANKNYEYIYEDDKLTISTRKGNRQKVIQHELNMNELEVIAPPNHESVMAYRKKEGNIRLKKYDYTSYDDATPYYTMIIMENHEKKKFLMDFNEEILLEIQRKHPGKVHK